MENREAIELVKDAAVYADSRWIPRRERLLEASLRYLVLIKNDYERRYSKEDCESRTQIRTDFCPNCWAKMDAQIEE